MKMWHGTAVALAIALSVIAPIRADEAVDKVINKAIKAHGGAEALQKLRHKGIIQNGKIHLHAMGLDIEGTMETTASGEGNERRFKQEMQLSVMGQNFTQTVGYDGKALWIAVNNKVVMTLDKKEDLEMLEEAAFSEEAAGLVLMKDKSVEVSIIGEDKVGDTPVIGIRVSKKGRKDVSLYFEKESGLLKRILSRSMDFGSRQEVEQERIMSDYKEMGGLMRPNKAIVNQDGKKLMEIEFTDTRVVDRIDEEVYARPKE